MKKKLLVATRNDHKAQEYARMLAALDVTLLTLDDVGSTQDVEETGETFQENAILKAISYAKESGYLTLADDSGLEVDYLNGDPGVYSARYGGAELSFEERYHILLENMGDTRMEKRTARFHCVIALADMQGRIEGIAHGVLPGLITFEPVGIGGFGYDPVFLLPDKNKTMAELSTAEKNKISHRALALQEIEPALQSLLHGGQ